MLEDARHHFYRRRTEPDLVLMDRGQRGRDHASLDAHDSVGDQGFNDLAAGPLVAHIAEIGRLGVDLRNSATNPYLAASIAILNDET